MNEYEWLLLIVMGVMWWNLERRLDAVLKLLIRSEQPPSRTSDD